MLLTTREVPQGACGRRKASAELADLLSISSGFGETVFTVPQRSDACRLPALLQAREVQESMKENEVVLLGFLPVCSSTASPRIP